MTEPKDLTGSPASQPMFVVAQITKNWLSGDTQVSEIPNVAKQFEDTIEAWRRRNYLLYSFQYNCLPTSSHGYRESIIAVFEKKGSKH